MQDAVRAHLFQSACCDIIISRNITFEARRGPEGKKRLQHALSCLARLQQLRRAEAPSSKSNEAEFLMQLEVELMLQSSEDSIDKMVASHLEQGAVPDSTFLFRSLRLCMAQLKTQPAVAKAAMRLANSCIQVLLCKDAAQPLIWADLADAMLLRIILMVQHGRHEAEPQNTPLKFWEEMHHSIKESAGQFPESHIQSASVYAYNYGVKAFYFGRKVEAEQWMAMSYKLSKLTRLMDKQTEDKISQAYEVVLER